MESLEDFDLTELFEMADEIEAEAAGEDVEIDWEFFNNCIDGLVEE